MLPAFVMEYEISFPSLLQNRIRNIPQITVNQAGFAKNCKITYAIQAARLLIEKYRDKHGPLCITPMNLKETIDLAPYRLIAALMQWIKLFYRDPSSKFRSVVGIEKLPHCPHQCSLTKRHLAPPLSLVIANKTNLKLSETGFEENRNLK